jgi:hypothetical protein
LLNFGREYANGLVGVHVLDYCQGYFYRNASGQKHLLDFEDDILERSKIHGKLRRWWRDVVGHQQRIVLATLPKTDLVTVPIGGFRYTYNQRSTAYQF